MRGRQIHTVSSSSLEAQYNGHCVGWSLSSTAELRRDIKLIATRDRILFNFLCNPNWRRSFGVSLRRSSLSAEINKTPLLEPILFMVLDRVDVLRVNQITPRTCAAYQLSDDASNSNAVALFMVWSSDDPPDILPSHVLRIVLCLECKLSSSSFPYDTTVYRWWDWTVPLHFSLLHLCPLCAV